VGGSDSGPSVLHRLVCDGELSKVVADHLGLDLDLVEDLSVVDSDDGSGHLWHDDHVPQMGLDHVGLLVCGRLLLLLAKLLDQGHGLALQATGELAADPAREQLHELLVVHVQELVEVDSAVRELAEGPALAQLGGGLFIGHVEVSSIHFSQQKSFHRNSTK